MSARTKLRAHAQRVPHLMARFFASLRARPLDDASDAWVEASLDPGERAAWNGMGRADRAEGVAVARRLEAELQDTPELADPRWRAAALLHDAGKQLSGYGTLARAAVTAIGMAAGDARMRRWAAADRGARARMGRYIAHDDLGAQLLRDLGARPEVAAWAAAHHRPARWPATGIPPAVCRALAEADGEPSGAIESNGPNCRYRAVAYRPETSYFVNLDAPPPPSRYAPHARENDWNGPPPGASPPRRRRRGFKIRPLGLVLVVLLGWLGWAYTTPGGPSARINDWIDKTRGDVDAVSAGPGLQQTATYFNQLYATQGSYPDMSDTAIQEDPNAGFGLGMSFVWCNAQAVVLRAPTADGSVSRLLVTGKDLGEVNGAPACPANLQKPSPWTADPSG